MSDAPFALYVDGELYEGWKSMRVTRGLERAAADFALMVSERWSVQRNGIWQIQPGATCEVRFQDETVLTGYVDSYQPVYDAEQHAVNLTGRSKTCDFIDSSITADGGQFRGLTVGQIAQQLAQPFGIEVVTANDGTPESEVQVQPGETCFALVEKLSRLQELLITDDALGRLVLTRAGSSQCSSALQHGVNIQIGNATLDNSKRFSDYTVKAQRPGNKTKDAEIDPFANMIPSEPPPLPEGSDVQLRYAARMAGDRRLRASGRKNTAPRTLTQIAGTVRDPGITRYRPMVIVAEAQADDSGASKRADWEMRRRIAQAVRASVTVTGWRQKDGRLWSTNEMVSVDAPWLGLASGSELIISAVTFSYDDSNGALAALELTLPDAFLPEARRQRKRRGGASGGKGTSGDDIFSKMLPSSPPPLPGAGGAAS